MRKTLATVAIMLLVFSLVPLGCTKSSENDEEAIRTLLNSSAYTNEEQTRGYGADDSTPTQGGGGFLAGSLYDGYDTIPFVRFRRFIPAGGISRTIVINIPAYPAYPDTTALATINSDIQGKFLNCFDTTTNPLYVWRKSVHDQAVRKVYLTKHDNRWHVRKLSPLEFTTVDPAYELRVVELSAHATSWPVSDTFCLITADTLLTRDELPCFVPADTVTVWVTATTTGDSCWAFLHHGRPKWPFRWRRPYFKTGTMTFERTWHIGPEGYERPQVRPSGHDAIGWSTLLGDSSKPYVAAAWGVPYIVKNPDEQIPEE